MYIVFDKKSMPAGKQNEVKYKRRVNDMSTELTDCCLVRVVKGVVPSDRVWERLSQPRETEGGRAGAGGKNEGQRRT